jgi:phenylacetate-CoA ligase
MILNLVKYYLSLNYWYSASPDSIKKMQARKFRKIFEFARQNSKFYREFYGDHGVLDLKIENLEDIKKIPVIDKKILRGNSTREIMTCNIDDNINIHSTSGSTGEPFKVAFNKFEDYTAHIRVFWTLRKTGYHINDKIIMVARYNREDHFDIEKDISLLKKFQEKLHLFQREIISCYEPIDEIISGLMNSNARILWSTPATMQVVADRLREKQTRLGFQTVVLTGEPISQSQKMLFTTYLGNYLISFYGAMESPCLGVDLGLTDQFTIFPSSNLFQFENITQTENGEKTGTVIISNLINKTMPIIRYNLNDFAVMDESPDFGIKYLNRIIGRQDDILELKNGMKLTELQTYEMFMDFHECETFKFIQKPDKKLVLQLIAAPGLSKSDVEKLAIQRWKKRFGDHPIEIEFVDHFEADQYIKKFKTMEKQN